MDGNCIFYGLRCYILNSESKVRCFMSALDIYKECIIWELFIFCAVSTVYAYYCVIKKELENKKKN